MDQPQQIRQVEQAEQSQGKRQKPGPTALGALAMLGGDPETHGGSEPMADQGRYQRNGEHPAGQFSQQG